MKTIQIEVTDEQYDKLVALAKVKKCTIAKCIQGFADSCQPGGSGWKHPEQAASEFEAKKKAVIDSSTS